MTVAALEAVLRLYSTGREGELPIWQTLGASATAIRRRAGGLAKALENATVVRGESVVGGGSVPGRAIPTALLRLPVADPSKVAGRLRLGNPPVFCRVEEGALVFDLRAVNPADDERLLRAISYALSQEG
jgi:L-seryl-tRNA(Ser) seleniumtransferase